MNVHYRVIFSLPRKMLKWASRKSASNLFPGMGAYSFLARTCGMGIAERMLASGEIYSARKLYELGIVNYLGAPGKGVESVEKFMRQHQQAGNGHRALQQVRQCYNPTSYKELADITELWVDAALRLEEANLRFIDRLVKSPISKNDQTRWQTYLTIETGPPFF